MAEFVFVSGAGVGVIPLGNDHEQVKKYLISAFVGKCLVLSLEYHLKRIN